MTDEVFMEEMNLPIEHGYSLHVLRKYCNTEDEKFICTLTNAAEENMDMSDPWDDGGGAFENVKVYSAKSVAKIIKHAYRQVKKMNKKNKK